MIYLSQRPDGVIVTGTQPHMVAARDELISCQHLGSRRRCCPDLYICRRDRSACIPRADFSGATAAGVTVCRDCPSRRPSESHENSDR